MQQHSITMNRVLNTPALVFFGLAYMVPLGIFTTYGQVTLLSEGHLPVAYIITLAAVFFTALSYCRMTSQLPLAGSAYSYVQKTFGGYSGFLVGWAQLLDYLFLPMINYIAVALYLNQQFPEIPGSVFILSTLFIVTLLNILGIKLVTWMNTVLIVLQLLFIGLFLYLCLRSDVSFTVEKLLAPLVFLQNQTSGLFAGAAVLCLAFLGFDAIATMAEETKDPKRTLPKAILYTVFIAGVLFIAVAYAAHLVYPEWQDFKGNTDTASVAVMERVGGALLASGFVFVYVTGVFASAMSSQASVVRIFYAMGREGVLPKRVFAYIHPRLKTPVLSIMFVSVISLFALVLSLDLVASMISFGALIAFTFVNLSVIKFYIIDRKAHREDPKALFTCLGLPVIGVILTLWLWTSLDNTALTVGVSWLVVGIFYLAFLTRGFRKSPPSISTEETAKIIQ